MIATTQTGLGRRLTWHFFVAAGPVGPYFRWLGLGVGLCVGQLRRAVKRRCRRGEDWRQSAASLFMSEQAAAREGFTQVLWLDALEGRYVEEVGAMNICFLSTAADAS